MGASENKRFIEQYFEKVGSGDPSAAELFAADITWWVPPGSDMAGLYEGRDAVLAMFGKGVSLYSQTDPMSIAVTELVAEGDTVCAQVVIRAKTAKGRDYENHYCFVFTLGGGQIRAVREYVDTHYAHEVLFA